VALVPVIGFLFGFLGSVPVAGPISVLVLERGLSGRFRSGLLLAIGSAVAESVYASLAFYGLSALLRRYPIIVPVSQCLGALVLLLLGAVLVRRGPGGGDPSRPVRGSSHGDVLLGFSITALNPTLIATWTAAVTALYASGLVKAAPGQAPLFSVGVCAGIIVWFAILLWLTRRYGARISRPALDRFVRLLGLVLMGMGVWFGVKFLQYLAVHAR
jgi:threonine/homoserine/homoserine lactone efflux protein